jgi:hypothetical protein
MLLQAMSGRFPEAISAQSTPGFGRDSPVAPKVAGGRFNTAPDRLLPDARVTAFFFHVELVSLLQYSFSCDTDELGLPSSLSISSGPEF